MEPAPVVRRNREDLDLATLATKLDNAKQTLELFQQMGEQDGIRQISAE